MNSEEIASTGGGDRKAKGGGRTPRYPAHLCPQTGEKLEEVWGQGAYKVCWAVLHRHGLCRGRQVKNKAGKEV